ncbi:MAG: phospholipase D family protein [Candidatus Diapherotrites archaeon]|nr:phospholipase D family protein [Candidatus Diapherotrites archaeon]
MKFNAIILLVILGFAIGAIIPFLLPDIYSPTAFAVQSSAGTIDSKNAKVYFCPQDDCSQKLVDFYAASKKSIHVMIYSFTKEEIAQALIDAKNRGIEVKVLIDNSQAGLKDAKDEFLLENGIILKRVNLPGNHILHNKVSIIDGVEFSTGSFNYTQNADSGNAENLLIVNDSALAGKFEEEFQKYWSAN